LCISMKKTTVWLIVLTCRLSQHSREQWNACLKHFCITDHVNNCFSCQSL